MEPLDPDLRKLSHVDLKRHWTILVERNVPDVKPEETSAIVWSIMGDCDLGFQPNFWHCVTVGRKRRLDECPCTECIRKRWRPQYAAEIPGS